MKSPLLFSFLYVYILLLLCGLKGYGLEDAKQVKCFSAYACKIDYPKSEKKNLLTKQMCDDLTHGDLEREEKLNVILGNELETNADIEALTLSLQSTGIDEGKYDSPDSQNDESVQLLDTQPEDISEISPKQAIGSDSVKNGHRPTKRVRFADSCFLTQDQAIEVSSYSLNSYRENCFAWWY